MIARGSCDPPAKPPGRFASRSFLQGLPARCSVRLCHWHNLRALTAPGGKSVREKSLTRFHPRDAHVVAADHCRRFPLRHLPLKTSTKPARPGRPFGVPVGIRRINRRTHQCRAGFVSDGLLFTNCFLFLQDASASRGDFIGNHDEKRLLRGAGRPEERHRGRH